MRQINLKTEKDSLERGKSRISLSLVLGLLLLFIVGAIIGGLFLYKSQLVTKQDEKDFEIEKKEESIDPQNFKEIYDLQGRIMDVEKHSSGANSQAESLSLISSRTFDDTTFDSIELEQESANSSIVSANIVVPDAQRLASQISAYEQSDRIEEFKLEKSSLEEEGVTATISFIIKSSEKDLKEEEDKNLNK